MHVMLCAVIVDDGVARVKQKLKDYGEVSRGAGMPLTHHPTIEVQTTRQELGRFEENGMWRVVYSDPIVSCGRCHRCHAPIRLVLDGEEWCDRCASYQRPRSHGWGLVGDRSPCPDSQG